MPWNDAWNIFHMTIPSIFFVTQQDSNLLLWTPLLSYGNILGTKINIGFLLSHPEMSNWVDTFLSVLYIGTLRIVLFWPFDGNYLKILHKCIKFLPTSCLLPWAVLGVLTIIPNSVKVTLFVRNQSSWSSWMSQKPRICVSSLIRVLKYFHSSVRLQF